MSGKRYSEEFKIEAIGQVTQRGYSVSEVSSRLGVTSKSLYDWIRKYGGQGLAASSPFGRTGRGQAAESRASAGHRRARYLKGSRRVLCRGVKEKYAFMKSRLDKYSISAMCRVLQVHRSGFHAWLHHPKRYCQVK